MAQIVNYKHVNLFNPQYQHKSLALAVIPALKGRRSPGACWPASPPKSVSFGVVGNPISKIRQNFFYAAIKVVCVCVYVFLHSLLQQVDINTPKIAGIILYEEKNQRKNKTFTLEDLYTRIECKLNTHIQSQNIRETKASINTSNTVLFPIFIV